MEQDIQKEQENKYIPKRKTYYFVSKSRLFFVSLTFQFCTSDRFPQTGIS